MFFNYTSSAKLVTDLKYYNTNYPLLEKKLNVCNDQVDLYDKLLKNTNTLLSGCKKDTDAYKDVSVKMEDNFKNCNTQLNKCKDDTPSRLTWFSVGALSTLLGIIGMFIVVK